MRLYFNRRPTLGPWGGGSKALSAIIDECVERGHDLFFEEDLYKAVSKFDAIICIDPRYSQRSGDFSTLLARSKRDSCPIIQRIGDLGTHGKPDLFEMLKHNVLVSDMLIFPSQWARDTLLSTLDNADILRKTCVIHNAPISTFTEYQLNTTKEVKWNYPMKLVTHHWSDNVKKGFDTYQFLSDYASDHSDFIAFTFIGRKPHNTIISNYIKPLDAPELAIELAKCDIYVTASKEEAGANHVLEAIAIGLPVLYHVDGGSIPEYAKDYGIEYSNNYDIISILRERLDELFMRNNREKRKMIGNIKHMAKQYVDLFEDCK